MSRATEAATEAAEAFLGEHPVGPTSDQEQRGARFDAGLAIVHFDTGSGGRGWDAGEQPAVDEVFLRAGCPDWSARNVIGLGMAAPTIHAHGTEQQRRRHLRPLFTGEDIWCQLFSEPGAGSDLAALATRAVRVEGGWRVSGQKVWTTLAHVARWGLLLARTDPEQPKHRGLTYFVLDMRSAGVDVRPLRQLTGEAEFNEVYLDDVFVPDDAVLGEVGGGWQVAMTTLMNERVSLGGRPAERGSGAVGQLVAVLRQARAAGRAGDAELDRVMRLWARAEAARLTNIRAGEQLRRGTPGPEGSIAKLQMAESNNPVYDHSMELLGTQALLYRDYTETRPDFAAVHGGSGDVRYDYLRSLANSIEGGTSEVLRTVLGERVLGLPPEPRPDKDTPWASLRRS
ncbi:MAG: mmgC 21 [Pseudonocardiales bacterium]|nr:mmgC 21 [Pseudonocardiales bacterium]